MIHCQKHNLNFEHRCPKCEAIAAGLNNIADAARKAESDHGHREPSRRESDDSSDGALLTIAAAAGVAMAEMASALDTPDFSGGGGYFGGGGASGSW